VDPWAVNTYLSIIERKTKVYGICD
jgi:hypothetical protein